MNRNVKILLFLIIFSLMTGCASYSQKTTETDTTSQEKSAMGARVESNLKKNIKDFKFLKVGMKRKDILKKLGEPARDVGSGLYIYVYELNDGANITLYFNSDDTLNKVISTDKNKSESKILLGT